MEMKKGRPVKFDTGKTVGIYTIEKILNPTKPTVSRKYLVSVENRKEIISYATLKKIESTGKSSHVNNVDNNPNFHYEKKEVYLQVKKKLFRFETFVFFLYIFFMKLEKKLNLFKFFARVIGKKNWIIKFYTEELTNDNEIIEILSKSDIKFDKTPVIEIIPVKSKDNTSFVDGICEVYYGEKLIHKLVIEITQTTDKESRNAYYQRIPKFIFAKHYLPGHRQIMYYKEQSISANVTSQIGLSILKLIGVETINVEFVPLSLDELIFEKNNIKNQKSHNTPYTVSIKNELSIINAKLKKGNSWSDPGMGYIIGMIHLLNTKKGITNFEISNHEVNVSKLKKTRNKFRKFVSLSNCEIRFQGTEVVWNNENGNGFVIDGEYFTILEDGEKLSMINFHNYLKQNGHTIFFTNIAGCERSKLVINGENLTFPKSMKIPDLITYKDGHLYFFEGECDYNIESGLEQIKGFGPCKKFVLDNMDKTPTNMYTGVITDKRLDMVDSNYFGYFLNKNDYLLKDGILH